MSDETLHEQFIQFLTEWLAWAEANKNIDEPDYHPSFSENYGLCAAWHIWIDVSINPDAKSYIRTIATQEGIYKPKGDYFGWYEQGMVPSHKWEPRLKWVRQYLSKNQGV